MHLPVWKIKVIAGGGRKSSRLGFSWSPRRLWWPDRSLHPAWQAQPCRGGGRPNQFGKQPCRLQGRPEFRALRLLVPASWDALGQRPGCWQGVLAGRDSPGALSQLGWTCQERLCTYQAGRALNLTSPPCRWGLAVWEDEGPGGDGQGQLPPKTQPTLVFLFLPTQQ